MDSNAKATTKKINDQDQQPKPICGHSSSANIHLNEGERYIGGIVDSAGVTTHIILLPGDFEGSWKQSMAWAAEQGGDLPNRVEQELLFATANVFESAWYWSNTEHASESGTAWVQYFNYGYQSYTRKGESHRARAVRRLVI